MSDSSSSSPRVSPVSMFLIAVLFVISGAAALIYEVVWTRQLTTFFGSTLYGVATVLAAFMGGLALGSLLLGTRADRFSRPLAVFGVFEILTGLAALAFPFALRAVQPIVGVFYVTGGEATFFLFSLVRFVIVFALLMVPTTLMGATLPLLSRAVTEQLEKAGGRIGWLYAVNTTGAVLGVFLAGFLLLEMLGVWRTTLVAAAGDITVGIVSIVLARMLPAVEPSRPAAVAPIPTPDVGGISPRVVKIVLATYAVSGFIALAYQVAWTRGLIFSFDRLKATTYSFSGMLVVFLLGLAIGSWIMQAVVDRQKNLLRLYGLIQAGIGLGGGLSFFMIVRDWPTLPEEYADGTLIYWNAVANVMGLTALGIALPTLLMGMAFPVVARIVVRSMDRVGGDVARVYALNTIGAIFGSFLGGFFLLQIGRASCRERV